MARNLAFIAACTADAQTLDKTALTPTGALGYGRDLDCIYDVTPDLQEVDPFSETAVGQALIRRLITPRGGLIDDPDYGFDLRGLCNRGLTVAQLQQLQSQVQNECTKDDRVSSVIATLAYSSAARTIDCALAVTLVGSGQTFKLVFAVTDADVLIDTIGVS